MKNMRKIIGIILLLAVILNLSAAASAAGEIMPRYNNALSANTTTSVSSSGLLTMVNRYEGLEGVTTRVELTTYLEKKISGVWTRVDIGTTDDTWYYWTNKVSYSGTRTFQLPSKGTYKVTTVFTFLGLGGSPDQLTRTAQVTW